MFLQWDVSCDNHHICNREFVLGTQDWKGLKFFKAQQKMRDIVSYNLIKIMILLMLDMILMIM